MLKRIYLSPLGLLISGALSLPGLLFRPFMVYGYFNHARRRFFKFSRISSTAAITMRSRLDLGDHAWIGHYCVIDASNGVVIGEGCQLSPQVCIFTHSSHVSIRLMGESYLEHNVEDRAGYQRGSVEIGEYTYIGAQSVILPGCKIGRGCVIGAKSLVTKDVPDFAVVMGAPARAVGDTREIDKPFFAQPGVSASYYDPSVMNAYLSKSTSAEDS
jgi:acetyltransferase-like isoleucine patch superfamily enzyme